MASHNSTSKSAQRSLFDGEAPRKKVRDITGERFGRLIALRFSHYGKRYMPLWVFRCDCGNEHVTRLHSVKDGMTTSCGCWQREERQRRKKVDLTGQRFGILTVVSETTSRKVGKRKGDLERVWVCRCDCGNEIAVDQQRLRGKTKSHCGCNPVSIKDLHRRINLAGQRFGRLTVLEELAILMSLRRRRNARRNGSQRAGHRSATSRTSLPTRSR